MLLRSKATTMAQTALSQSRAFPQESGLPAIIVVAYPN
jgi:hypothetical protein